MRGRSPRGEATAAHRQAATAYESFGLREGAAGSANLMELIVAAARVRATEGEMVAALKEVFGDYREPAWL